jgi:hypothetical protein
MNPSYLASTRLITGLLLLAAAALACSSSLGTVVPTSAPSEPPHTPPRVLHFENEGLAFDYPEGMAVYVNNDPAFMCYPHIDLEGVVAVGLGDARFYHFDTYFRSIRIIRRPAPSQTDLEAIAQATYEHSQDKFPHEAGLLEADGPITINGLTGLQKTYRVYSGEPAYELRDIWLHKDDEIIILSIWSEYTNPDDFARFQANADMIVNSLVIK